MKLKGYLLAAVSAATYGAIPLFAIPLKKVISPFDTVLTYHFLLTAVIIGVYLVLRKENLKINLKESLTLIVLGLLFAMSSHFLFWAYDFMSAGVASTILFMYPVFVALIMTYVFKEKASWVLWISIGLAFLGIYLLEGGGSDSSIPLKGLIIVITSALSYGLYIIVINKSVVSSMSGAKLTFYSMLVTGLIFLVKSMYQGGLQPIPNAESWMNITLLSVICAAISCITMVYAVQYIGSTITAVMGALEPVVAVAIGILFFQEHLTFDLTIGILFILITVTLIVLADQIVNKTQQAKVYLTPRLFSIRKRNNRKHMN